MNYAIILKGLVVGFSIAMVVGPNVILCIQRTLNKGFFSGLRSGLGAALADGIFAGIGVFGITSLSASLLNNQFWIKLFGGIFLLYLGISILLKKPDLKVKNTKLSKGSDTLSVFLLSLANPIMILYYLSIFAGLNNINSSSNWVISTQFVVAVFVGSMIWWLILSSVAAFLHSKLSERILRIVNLVGGLIIVGFAVYLMLSNFK